VPDSGSPAGTGRETARRAFLAAQGWADAAPRPLAADASFRRYYRLVADERRAVLMDAPPPQEDVASFVAVAAMLRAMGLSTPEIFAEDRADGFLLLEDFGDDTYTRLIARGADEKGLYALAIDTLVELQRRVAGSGVPGGLPAYDETRLVEEALLLVDWHLPALLGRPLEPELRDDYRARWTQILRADPNSAGPPGATLVLRDYHVDNLMLLPGRPGVRACGLLDFQDAVSGMASYDLVSLIEDARRDVATSLQAAMTERYLAAFPALDRAAFRRSAAILAAQRHAKVIGIFTRLWKRDGKPQYLAHLPRVWRLLEERLGDPSLAPIAAWLDRHVPAERRGMPDPRQAAS
jgi:aminoglycoside/choline kinase family phosphotransferase